MIDLKPEHRSLIQGFLDENIDQTVSAEIMQCIDAPDTIPVISYDELERKLFDAWESIRNKRLNDQEPEVLLLVIIIHWIFDWDSTNDGDKWWEINNDIYYSKVLPEKYRKKPEGRLEKRTLTL